MNMDPISLSGGSQPALIFQKSFSCWNDKRKGNKNTQSRFNH